MRIEHDKEVDAVYLFIEESGAVAETTVMGEDKAAGINLDLDASGKILGIEILDASRRLPASLLK